MATRTWLGTLLIVALALLAFIWMVRWSSPSPLRSEHSEPAAAMPASQVVVGSDGKIFHKSGCPFIHGERKEMDGKAAVKQGYAPCVHCEKEFLRHSSIPRAKPTRIDAQVPRMI